MSPPPRIIQYPHVQAHTDSADATHACGPHYYISSYLWNRDIHVCGRPKRLHNAGVGWINQRAKLHDPMEEEAYLSKLPVQASPNFATMGALRKVLLLCVVCATGMNWFFHPMVVSGQGGGADGNATESCRTLQLNPDSPPAMVSAPIVLSFEQLRR